MAQLATEMLPTGEQGKVAGPTSTAAASTDTAIGSTPPPIELPSLGTNTPVTTSSYRGKYVAVNFWSPTCTLCLHELPAMETVSKELGTSAALIGVR